MIAIVIGSFSGCFLLLIGFAIAWKFRYFYLSNRMRVEFITDRGTFTRIIKVDQSTDHFEIVISGRKYMFAVDIDRQRASGKERIPKQWHYIGDVLSGDESKSETIPLFEPLDMRIVSVTHPTSGLEYRNAATNTVMRDLLNSFKKPKIDSTMALFITLGAMLIGFSALGVFSNSRFEDVLEALATSTQKVF
jgi:hypothetical protein